MGSIATCGRWKRPRHTSQAQNVAQHMAYAHTMWGSHELLGVCEGNSIVLDASEEQVRLTEPQAER